MGKPTFDDIPLDIDWNDDEELDKHLNYADIESEHAVHVAEQFDTILIIDSAPIVDEKKRDKLFQVIRKQFAKEGVNIKEDGFFMPMEKDASGKMMSKGFLFVDFETSADADLALKNLQYFKFDKAHVFYLNRFSDIEKYAHVPEEWDQEKALGQLPDYRDQDFLRSWLLDPAARDQIVVYNKDTVSLMWNNRVGPPEIIHERENWTERYIALSPRGSYMASVHRQGIALWGGASMARLSRFHHPNVRVLDFSPNETYLVTFSPDPLPAPSPEKPWGPESTGHHVIIWDVRTARIMRTLALSTEEISNKNIAWPFFKWSWDEKYFARIVNNAKLHVYQTPEMGLLDKKAIAIAGIAEFEWMPYTPDTNDGDAKKPQGRRNLVPPYTIAYFVPQSGGDHPAQLSMMSVPNRQLVRSKQVFFGLNAKIHFQSQGDYVLFKVDRTNRSGKAAFVSLEVFRLREKEFPAESIEIKELIVALGWEPNNNRFALITTSDVVSPDLELKQIMAGAPGKMSVHLYQVENSVEKKGANVVPGGVRLMHTMQRKTVNSIFWSPKGRFLVLAGLRNLQGVLEFYDVEQHLGESGKEMTTVTELNGKIIKSSKEVDMVAQLAATEHHGATDLAWDPSGRYVMTSASLLTKNVDQGFQIWDIRGSLLVKQSRESFKQAVWRPRPPTLLSKQKLKSIKKNMSQYSREFDIQDATESSALSAHELEERKRLFDEWSIFRSEALMSLEACEVVETILDQ